MKIFYLKASGLIIEFDQEEAKFGIQVLEKVIQLAKDLQKESDGQFISHLEAIHSDILNEEYASIH